MTAKNKITITVNGKEHSLEITPDEVLVDTLRKNLKLTGTKVGCEEAECGVCTVLIDGEPTMSCVYPAARADGKEIVTIEGLANSQDGELVLHPLQDAFVQHGAVQCGFCIPGQIMTSYALIKRTPEPTSDDIRHALKDTLCRCAGYPLIEEAILDAAHALRTGDPIQPASIPQSAKAKNVIGKSQIRPDAIDKVTGSAIYTDDLLFDGMLFATVRRAEVPHAILKGLDISKAKALPGVVAVLTAEDIPGEQNHGVISKDWPVMIGVGERIRYVGDALVIIAAETQEIADQAASLVDPKFELQEVIRDAVHAYQSDAPQIHESGNLLKHIKIRKGDVDAGFEDADVVIEHTFHTVSTDHAFLEPECSVAVPLEDGQMEVYVGSQVPYGDRHEVAEALGWPEERVRVIGQLVGGGFGGKEDIAGQIHAALLADVTKRPVKLLFDRQESLLVHPKRHATQIKVKLGAKKDGRILAAETELYGDTGAYASLGEKVMGRATSHSAGPYNIENVRADCYAMYTNSPPAGAFRGFGVSQSAFAVESMQDMLAETLGLDPVDLRRTNALSVGGTTSTGQKMRESVGLQECISKVEEEMLRIAGEKCGLTRENLFKAHADSANPHLIHAWGFASFYKNTGLGEGAPDKSGANLELYDDGTFEVRSAAAEIGQGMVSIMQMMVAEELAIQPEQVSVLVMDTDLSPDGGPTTASRQTYITGNASRYAAISLREAMARAMAEKFNMPPDEIKFEDGKLRANGSTLSYAEVAKEMKDMGLTPRVEYEYEAPKTQALGTEGDTHFAYSFATQAAEVEVNTLTGQVRVLRVVAANDVGAVINPLGLRGQVEGGVMMGIGNALTENFIVEDGYVVTDRLASYRIPSISLTPEINTIAVEHPTADGPHGAKGVGEIVNIPTTPAITNAIYNAVGVRVDTLPVDQEKIAMELAEKRKKETK